MANWQEVIAHFAYDVEQHFDQLKYRLRERIGGRDPIMIRPYRGFGSQEKLYLKGRVLEDKGISPASENDTLWDNLVSTYQRFESDEIPYARVLARFQGIEKEVTANEEGFFEVLIEPEGPLPGDKLWHQIDLELLHPLRPGYPPVHAEGQVFVPQPNAQFGVISDIDDTVLQTDATSILRMARNVFLGNARTRLPFKGVGAFYRALFRGAPGGENDSANNPLFYVSSSPWNLYTLLSEFFQLQDIPIGPILFLRDWGLKEDEVLPIRQREYKLGTVNRIIEVYPDLPFILIGDSGQEDPEIYAEVVSRYPDRILAIYIRNVTRDLNRPEAIRQLAEEVTRAGSALILADDTLPMAQHAAEMSWISPQALPDIETEKEADEAPPTPVEKLLGETKETETPTVVVETESAEAAAGAVEEALEIEPEPGQEPPAVRLDGEETGGPSRSGERDAKTAGKTAEDSDD